MTELEHAIKHIKTRADAWAVKEVTDALRSISERLEKALSQEQKSGKWLYIREDKYTCSKCGTITRVDEGGIDEKPMYKFCPYCGCRMVEPQESEE